MRNLLFLIAISAVFTSCTTVVMKRCPDKAQDEDLFQCEDVVQGVYRDCKKPKDLYRCTDPQ